ncbi:MAG: outer membrane lipoprotein carrier protein LolA [Pyrinomonadaceae bacterium]|nr:outer membrane lipoprotein carrier protein LolA [Acidobacteriota bacterium]MBP7377192.1 outer membrane lipoprotein carrier protein LolA [Pyrinomonadaceae bacterium]
MIKNIFKSTNIVRTLVFSAAIGLMLAGSAAAQGPLGKILNIMDANYKNLTSLKSNVTMVKTDSVLGESDTYEGKTSFLPESYAGKKYVRIDWSKPVVENIVVIGDSYQLYRPKLNQVIKGQTSSAKSGAAAGGALAFVSMSKDQLKANYNVVFIAEEAISGGVKTIHLQLTPKVKTSYKTADLWVDGDGMPRQAKVTENNNDTTTVLLTGIEKNTKVDYGLFKLALPKNVKVVTS